MPVIPASDKRTCKTCLHNTGGTCSAFLDAVTGEPATLVEARRTECNGKAWEGRELPTTSKPLWASDRKTYDPGC